MKLTKNFSSEEFECKCGKCEPIDIDMDMVNAWQKVRDHFGQTVTITSGYRCLEYNRSIGSTDGSSHPKGKAGDGQVANTKPKDVADFLEKEYPDSMGIGRYKDFTHIDSRKQKAYRWGSN